MYEGKQMERISITVPKKFLDEFDKNYKKFGYSSRSNAITDAMRNMFKERLSEQDDTEIDGFLVIAYNHHQRGLLDDLTEIEHHSNVKIYATLHIHVSEHNCSEVIALRGKMSEVRKFRKKVQIIKGILLCELVPLYTFIEHKFPGDGSDIQPHEIHPSEHEHEHEHPH
ncbi:MAG: nickel-responsive transcriptional regulator NikR [Promethearchaeota archaeon]